MMYDRGAFKNLIFQRCDRGFLLRADFHTDTTNALFAFDRVEDVAAWLVEQYRDAPEEGPSRPTEESA